MNHEEVGKLKDYITNARLNRMDEPMYSSSKAQNRNRFKTYIFKLIDEFVELDDKRL